MRFGKLARQLPARVAAGAFILNSGIGKWSADEETAGHLQGIALAKDVWMLGIGLSLIAEDLAELGSC